MENEPEDEVIWARDLDGTGSMHMCAPEDEGARMFIREDIVVDMVYDQHMTYATHAELRK